MYTGPFLHKTLRLMGKAPLLVVIGAIPMAQAEENPDWALKLLIEAEKDQAIQGTGRSLDDHPGAATVVTQEEIEENKPLSTVDVLRKVPGVHAPKEHGRGLRPNIGFRGMNPSRSRSGTLLTADGAPLQPAVYGAKSAYYNLPVDNVERIEVIRGASSVLYGPGSVGGVVNYVTKNPPAEPEIGVRETIRQGGLFNTHLSWGNSTDEGTGMLVSYANKEGELMRDNTETSLDDFNIKARVPTAGGGEMTYRVNYYREVSETPGGLTAQQFKKDPEQSQRSHDVFKGRRGSFDVNYQQPLSGNKTFQGKVYMNWFERNWYIADDVDGAATSNSQFLREFFVMGAEPRLTVNDWKAGVRVHFENMNNVSREGDSPGARSGKTTGETSMTTTALSGYLEGDHPVTQRLTLTPGIRYEWIDQELSDGFGETHGPGGGGQGTIGQSLTQEVVGGLGFRYALEPVKLYGGYHRTFQPPSFRQAIDPTTGTDTDLDAEKGDNYELGLRGNVSRDFHADVTLFHINFDNKIVTESGQQTNGGRTTHNGIEAALNYRMTNRITTDVNYTYSKAEFDQGANKGNQLPMAPENKISWGLNYAPSKRLKLRLDGRFVDEQFTDAANTVEESADGASGQLPEYDVWNLRADYNFGNVKAFAGINNLLDEEYRVRRQAFFNGIIPGQKRSVYAGFKAKF